MGSRVLALMLALPMLVATQGASADSAVPDPGDDAGLSVFVDTAMRALMEGFHVPSAAVAVVDGERVLYARGYGYADVARRIPADAHTLFRMGSISKLFTWTALMQLSEQGRLDLDRSVNSYLRGWQIPERFGTPMTSRHLMTHTAGFEESFLGFADHSRRPDPANAGGAGTVPLEEYLRSHVPERVRPPGEMTAYSNYGAALAGLMVQNVSGMPYAEYIRRNIFVPLGMQGATFAEPLAGNSVAAVGYVRKLGVSEPRPFEYIGSIAPAGAASASASDMAKFMIAHLNEGRTNGSRILEERTARLMHTRAFSLHPDMPGMALGFYEQRINAEHVIAHAGDTSEFHCGLLLLPQRKIGVFVAFVGDGGSGARSGFERAFFDRYFPRTPTVDEKTVPASLSAYEGTYLPTRRNWSSLEKLLAVLGPGIQVVARPGGRLLVSGMGEESWQFVPSGHDTFMQIEGERRIGFRRDSEGKVSHLGLDNLPFMPAERVVGLDVPGFWHLTLAGVSVLLLDALLTLCYRCREVRTLPAVHRRAVYASAAVALCWYLMVLTFGGLGLIYQESIILHVSWALRIALILPLVFVAATAVLCVFAVRVWRQRCGSIAWRIHYSVLAIAALWVCVFLLHWNVLGWQFA